MWRYSRRLQIQERFTHQMAEAVRELTGAVDTLVVCDARCVMGAMGSSEGLKLLHGGE